MVVVAIGGLMGAGKSTLARGLAPGLGAVVVSSDGVRKRRAGVAEGVRLGAAHYTAAAQAATMEAVLAEVRELVAAGRPVVVDATFLDPRRRRGVEAAAAGAAFLGVWLEVGLAELERRVAARAGDASDATVAVLRAAAGGAGAPEWLVVDAGEAARARERVQLALGMLWCGPNEVRSG